MAPGTILRQRTLAPAIAGISAALLLSSRPVLHAESAQNDAPTLAQIKRKSFYDEPSQSNDQTTTPKPKRKPSTLPSPTDRLTGQVARARLAVHSSAARLEDNFNSLVSRAFKVEHNFTNTIASLAPSRQSGEEVLPGAIYVLVAAMGTSILSRNRNILLRATLPVAVGIGAAKYLLPITSRNVGDLVWSYEKRFPVLADWHERTQDRVVRFVRTSVDHSKMGVGMLEDKIGEARKNVEGWVSKGT